VKLVQEEDVKYFRLHLDRRLTSHKHIYAKWKQLVINLTKLCWLLGCNSKLSTSNKLLIYKMILKPIWTYRIKFWGMASTSNIENLECFKSKDVHMIVDALLYMSNMVIQSDLYMPTVKEDIHHYNPQNSVCLSTHPKILLVNLMAQPDNNSRLQRRLINDLQIRFLE
jgi:hypothetical protein